MSLITLIIAEYRVCRLITTQVEIVNLDGLTASFLYIHRDFTLHDTT